QMLMVGLGGVFVEVLKDVSFRLCPINREDAHSMLNELRGAALLDGARGTSAVDRVALVELLLRVGGEDGLLTRYADRIAELDLNPVIARGQTLCAVDARVLLRAPTSDHASTAAGVASDPSSFDPLFTPRSVAVVGASSSDVTMANSFIKRMQAFGYAGDLYAIHPKAEQIEGVPCHPTLDSTPQPVDYAYVCIGAARVPSLLRAAHGRVRIAQVVSSGFGEVEAGVELERELVAAAREGGCRVIGPNCLGAYSPRGGLTFAADAPRETGRIGILAQSGGLSTDVIKRGQWRGLRFSGVVTVGNCADVQLSELLAWYLNDEQTAVIGLYIEDARDGRALFELLRHSQHGKPVVILKGGRTDQGRQAAASHTGALAGDHRAWEALCQQTGCVMVDTIDDFIDVLHALEHLRLRPRTPTREVVLFGNGGGTSVLATDQFARLGLDVKPFGGTARAQLDALALPPGTSLANPIDTPVRTLQEEHGFVAKRILDIVYAHSTPQAVLMHLNLASFVGRGPVDPLDNLLEVIRQVQDEHRGVAHFTLALRSDGSPQLDESKRRYRQRAIELGIPVFDEIDNAALALAAVARLEQRMASLPDA
ncbi:MAG: acetate--CoA ligase family protein, partial [Gammaproteobacteria bacterium]|nr:acetate--CoA ligase family protein [Gammaproteobacteria bacterium]